MKKLLILICLICLIPAIGWGLTDVEVGISKNTGDEPDATTSVKGIVELATDGEDAANVVVQGNDSRLDNTRTPSNDSVGPDQMADGDHGDVSWSSGVATVEGYEPADSAITKTDEVETITANWVNTANPWADNEIASSSTWNAKLGPVGPVLNNGDTSAGYMDFLEDSDNGTNYLRLLGPPSCDTITVNLPATAGTLALTNGVTKENLDTNSDVVDVEATLASNDSDDMLVTAGAIIDYVISYCTDFITASDVDDNVTRFICIAPVESDTAVTVADGTVGIPITADLNGWDIVDAYANVRTKGVTGTTDIQIRKQSGATDVDVLSTKLTLGDEYYCSDEVINTSNDALATGDMLFVDVDAIHSGTAPNGLSVVIVVQLP